MKKRVLSFFVSGILMLSAVACTRTGNDGVVKPHTMQTQESQTKLLSEGVDTNTEVEYTSFEGENSSVFLSEGDKIAVISPSALPTREQTDSTINGLKEWGYIPVEGQHVCAENRTLEDIVEDLNWALDDPEIKAIFCVRGGYGASEAAEVLPEETIKKAGKLIIGYSDITVYHSAWTKAGVPSIHACMSGTFDGLPDSCYEAEKKILQGEIPTYTCDKGKFSVEGNAKGVLIGGNLSTFTSVIDTAFDCTKTGQPYILFLEDVGEDLQHIHRYLTILKHNGVIENAAGIVFGEWTELPEDLGDYYGRNRGGNFSSIADMITKQFLTDLNVPVAFGFPAGHGDINYPLLMGEMAELTVDAEKFTLACGVKNETDVDKLLGKMSLRDKVEQMMLISYRKWDGVAEESASDSEDVAPVNVTELNDVMKEDFKTHHYGGVLLFGENFVDAEQTINLISSMQNSNLAGGGIPLLVSIDQEGGNVARLSFGTTGVGNMALAATGDPQNARTMAGIYGKELSLLGINVDFAPVVDINNNPNNPVIGVRSFSEDPEIVSEYAVEYMDGLHDGGVISSLKHFPGHGNTDTDSHTGFPCIDASYDELKEFELIPFKKAIDAGADMVMTAHIQYPQIETETSTSISTGEEVYIPATMSHRILTEILRGDLGFEGVVVTDALDMQAITDNFAPDDVMRMTINAGANLIMLPPIHSEAQYGDVCKMVEAAVKLAEEGTIDEEKINDSVRRILTLKSKYGLLEKNDFEVNEDRINEAVSGVGSAENRETAMNIANKALTLVKNDSDAFPIKTAADETTLILFSNSCGSRIGTGDLVRKMLKEKGVITGDSQIVTMVNDKDNAKACIEAAEAADHCILVSRAYNVTNLDPADTSEGFSTSVFDKILENLHKKGKTAVVVSCQLPYDAARFENADALLACYNSAVMRELPPESGVGSAYAPNLVAALMACFGDGNVTGSLPVNIPKLNDEYEYTDEILYERSQRD